MDDNIIMAGVREHGEGFPVRLVQDEESGRLCFLASNQGGFDSTMIDARDLADWLASNPLPDSPTEKT